MRKISANLKRFGWVAFFFFLIKGLIWLALAFGIGKLLY